MWSYRSYTLWCDLQISYLYRRYRAELMLVLNRSVPIMTIITAADDGLIVMWEQQHFTITTSNDHVNGGISGRNHHPSTVESTHRDVIYIFIY
jgi:hypothetical protein